MDGLANGVALEEVITGVQGKGRRRDFFGRKGAARGGSYLGGTVAKVEDVTTSLNIVISIYYCCIILMS